MVQKIKVSFPSLDRSVQVDKGDNLLEVIRLAGIDIDADCGSVGRCGKCKVIINGKPALACLTYVLHDMFVEIPSATQAAEYDILLDSDDSGSASSQTSESGTEQSSYVIALDIGTTTVVAKLLDKTSGRELASFAELNAQLSFGADVISRINASLDDSSELSKLITEQIDRAIVTMLEEKGIDGSQVEGMVLAGNTTMTYILLGLPCRSLGFVPFEPAYTYPLCHPYQEIFKSDTLNCEVVVLPHISAYVGGDLTAGLIARQHDQDFILMDMGTNGELLFKRGDRLVCTATAAGPAFEGGNIECGTGSMKGAISSVSYENGDFKFKTIGNASPIGICGSGILDLMAVLIQEDYIDSTGLFTDKVPDERIILYADPDDPAKEVYFSQKDARQFQLAKSAVRTGLEIISEEMGGEPPAQVFLAGGFGQNLNPISAIAVGMLPENFKDIILAIGNSCLSGTVKAALDDSLLDAIEERTANGHEINLAAHKRFNDLFMDHMYF